MTDHRARLSNAYSSNPLAMDEQNIIYPGTNNTVICPSNGYTFQRTPRQASRVGVTCCTIVLRRVRQGLAGSLMSHHQRASCLTGVHPCVLRGDVLFSGPRGLRPARRRARTVALMQSLAADLIVCPHRGGSWGWLVERVSLWMRRKQHTTVLRPRCDLRHGMWHLLPMHNLTRDRPSCPCTDQLRPDGGHAEGHILPERPDRQTDWRGRLAVCVRALRGAGALISAPEWSPGLRAPKWSRFS